ncbi:MAG: hypothetical protein QG632_54 [Candidatus Dependentiae bacterium]|nr:hypothetical protein [Candidatus Dependentiae bacterium]
MVENVLKRPAWQIAVQMFTFISVFGTLFYLALLTQAYMSPVYFYAAFAGVAGLAVVLLRSLYRPGASTESTPFYLLGMLFGITHYVMRLVADQRVLFDAAPGLSEFGLVAMGGLGVIYWFAVKVSVGAGLVAAVMQLFMAWWDRRKSG